MSTRFVTLLLLIALTGTFTGACNMKIPFMGKTIEIDDCDPVANYFENGQHYIGADFVKEDGTIDYEKYFQAQKTQSSPCDPLNRPDSKTKEPGIQPVAPSTKPGIQKPGTMGKTGGKTSSGSSKEIAPGNAGAPRDEPKPADPDG